MKIQRFRIAKNGRLAGLVFVTENENGKTASIVPLAPTGEFPDVVDFEATRLVHQQFAARFQAGEIVRQLVERAGFKMDEVTIAEFAGPKPI